jgi:hypothetical protein
MVKIAEALLMQNTAPADEKSLDKFSENIFSL